MAIRTMKKPATRKTSDKPSPVPLDVVALARSIDGRGSLWIKEGLNFDHKSVAVVGWAALLNDGPGPRLLTFQTYDGYLSKSNPGRTLDLETAKVVAGTDQDVVGRLEKRGYSVYTPQAVAPQPKRRGRPRKGKSL